MRLETQCIVSKQLFEFGNISIIVYFTIQYMENMFPKWLFRNCTFVSNRISLFTMYNFCFQSHYYVSNRFLCFQLISFPIVILPNVCFQMHTQSVADLDKTDCRFYKIISSEFCCARGQSMHGACNMQTRNIWMNFKMKEFM